MWSPAGATRNALALAMAAAVAFLGSATMLRAGSLVPQGAGGHAAGAEPGAAVLSIALLLAAAGMLLAVMATRELLVLRRGAHSR